MDATPVNCDDLAHRRLFWFGVVLIVAFAYIITLVWLRELKISDGIFSNIVNTFTAGISAVIVGLSMSRRQQQQPPQQDTKQ